MVQLSCLDYCDTIDELLRSIINQLYKERNELFPGRIDAMEGTQLVETLRHFLFDKRCVVVLDDLWHSVLFPGRMGLFKICIT